MSELKIKISGRLDLDKETEERIKEFTSALSRLPQHLNYYITLDGVEGETPLKINLADLLIDQVKTHFGRK
jgi:hypothetical protein